MNEENKPIVYLSGRMRGLSDYGRAQFHEAEKMLKGKGYAVINPAQLPIEIPFEHCMPICTSMIDGADMVALLDGWEESPGAELEKKYAEYQGKPAVPIKHLL